MATPPRPLASSSTFTTSGVSVASRTPVAPADTGAPDLSTVTRVFKGRPGPSMDKQGRATEVAAGSILEVKPKAALHFAFLETSNRAKWKRRKIVYLHS